MIRELEAIVGADHVRTDAGDVEPYARDATPTFRAVPDAVVWPRTAEEVAAILRLATARRRAGGAARRRVEPVRGDRRRPRRDRPGADPDGPDPGGQLGRAARPGARPASPPRRCPTRRRPRACSTRRTRAAAPSRPSGATSPPARAGCAGSSTASPATTCSAPTAVLPTGEIIKTGGRLWKDVAGYDLTRLLTGSEGTLGVLTEVTVALLPMPRLDQHRRRVLPDAGRRRAGGRRDHRRRDRAGDAGVPRRQVHRCRRGVRAPRAARRRRGAAAVRRRRRRGRRRPQPGPDRGDLHRDRRRWR